MDGVNSTEQTALLRKRIARIGQRTRPGRSPTKSVRDWTITDLGRGCDTASIFARKTGHNGRPDRLPYTTLRMREPGVPLYVWRKP